MILASNLPEESVYDHSLLPSCVYCYRPNVGTAEPVKQQHHGKTSQGKGDLDGRTKESM